ncbi:MAG: hypothetical protein HWE16_00880 [Gammaproteobacteria bacterium]|nr:hypothetical protein [Gammaproteobacteria bacterium]
MSDQPSFKQKIAHHSLSIVSLVIAIIALTYNTWRSDTTEYNRNIRTASFELIKELGSLQNITNQLHFSNVPSGKRDELIIQGWGHIALIEDLSALLPDSISQYSTALKSSWQRNVEQLAETSSSEKELSKTIADTRAATRKLLSTLD